MALDGMEQGEEIQEDPEQRIKEEIERDTLYLAREGIAQRMVDYANSHRGPDQQINLDNVFFNIFNYPPDKSSGDSKPRPHIDMYELDDGTRKFGAQAFVIESGHIADLDITPAQERRLREIAAGRPAEISCQPQIDFLNSTLGID